MRSGMRALALVLAVAGVTGCDPNPPPPASKPAEQPKRQADPVYAYSTAAGLRVMRGADPVAQLPTDRIGDAEWAADGSRFVAATSKELASIDVRTGTVTKVPCTCSDIAIAAGKIFATNEYGSKEATVYDLTTLKKVDTTKFDLAVQRMDGAGDRLVTFQITAEGARALTDVVLIDPKTGARNKVGDAISPIDAAYTPRSWRGGPMFAYAVNGSTSAMTGVGAVRWFDPTSPDQQVEIDDRPLRAKSPDVPDNDWNSAEDHLWWAADGSLRVTARTWTCDRNRTRCTTRMPKNQWRYDGTHWSTADDRELESVRDIGPDLRLEQTAQSRNFDPTRLTLVDKDKRTDLRDDVGRVWTPPQLPSATPPPPNAGSQDLAERYAPVVWLHRDEPDFPTSTTTFVHSSTLWFDHGSGCTEVGAVAVDVDEAKLGRGEYEHPGDAPTGSPGECVHLNVSKVYRTNQDVDEEDGNGFYLAVDKEALHGNKPDADGKVSAPVYWQYVDGGDGEHGAYLYWFFYGNDTYTWGHQGDWERVAVQLTDGRPTGVAFWKHEAPVCTTDWSNMERSADHPVVYSAKGAHGSYPRQGSYPVYDKTQLGTDETGKGFVWDTAREVRSVKDEPWYGYLGHWGRRGSSDTSSGKQGPHGGRNVTGALTTTKCDAGLHLDFVGMWKSTRQIIDPKPYQIEVNLKEGHTGDEVGTAAYPGLGCDGVWVLTETSPDRAVFRESRRAAQEVTCAGSGTIELTKTPTGLHYSRTDDHRPGTTTTDLTRG